MRLVFVGVAFVPRGSVDLGVEWSCEHLSRFVNACESEGDWPFSPSKNNVGQHAPVREHQNRKSLVGSRVFTVHLRTVP